MMLEPGVDNKKHGRVIDDAKRDPAFLVFGKRIALGQREGILKYEHRGLEADIVLQEVLAVLCLVPLKTHRGDPALRLS